MMWLVWAATGWATIPWLIFDRPKGHRIDDFEIFLLVFLFVAASVLGPITWPILLIMKAVMTID